MSRVRWGNVGKLAALVAGAVLLATGPKGCGRGEAPVAVEAAPVHSPRSTVDRAVAPAPVVKPEVPVRRKRRVRHRKPRPHIAKPVLIPKPVLISKPVLFPRPATQPPAASTGEFGP